MNRNFYLLLIFLFSLSACARSMTQPASASRENPVDFKVQVADPQCVFKGDLVMEPFRPGEGVPANSEVSTASLKMVKGFVEAMEGQPSSLHVVTDTKTDEAVFFIKGHVTACEHSQGMIDHWQKKPNVFAVEGKLIHLETDRAVFSFSARVASTQENNIDDFASRIGQRLAAYLLEQSKDLP